MALVQLGDGIEDKLRDGAARDSRSADDGNCNASNGNGVPDIVHASLVEESAVRKRGIGADRRK